MPRLAVFTNNRHQVFQSSVIDGAQDMAAARGFELEVTEVPQGVEDVAATGLSGRGSSGALIVATALPDALLSGLAASGLPLTLVSHRLPGTDLPSVIHDNRQGMAQLASHLALDCARKSFLFVRGDPLQRDAAEREAAFRHEVMRHGLFVPEERYLEGAFEPERAAQAVEEYLGSGPEPDALVAADYLMAIAALQVLRRQGRRVPEDVAVVGFGDGPEAARAGLTTVAADVVELGRRAARQLIGQVEGLEIRGQTLLSTTLIRRATSCVKETDG